MACFERFTEVSVVLQKQGGQDSRGILEMLRCLGDIEEPPLAPPNFCSPMIYDSHGSLGTPKATSTKLPLNLEHSTVSLHQNHFANKNPTEHLTKVEQDYHETSLQDMTTSFPSRNWLRQVPLCMQMSDHLLISSWP